MEELVLQGFHFLLRNMLRVRGLGEGLADIALVWNNQESKCEKRGLETRGHTKAGNYFLLGSQDQK